MTLDELEDVYAALYALWEEAHEQSDSHRFETVASAGDALKRFNEALDSARELVVSPSDELAIVRA